MAERGIHAAFKAQHGKQVIHIIGHRRFKRQRFVRFGVNKAQAISVQGLAGKGFDFGFHFGRARMARVAVHRVACQRMARFAHMHADLVGAPRFQAAFNIAMRLITLQNFNVGNRFFAAKFHHRHFQTIMRVAPDLGFNFAIKRHNAIGDGAVNAFHAAALQLLHQMVLRGQRFGDHHQATGVFVQAVHDACAWHLR